MSEKKEKIKVTTPLVRASFPFLDKPNNQGQYPDNKYKVTGLIEKDREAELKPLKQAILKAAQNKWGKINYKDLETPFRDGDEKEKMEGYAGCVYFTAKSDRKPGIVGPDTNPLPEGESIYGGCYVKFSCVPYAYERGGEVVEVVNGQRKKTKETIRGVGLGLQNIQFIRHGESFGGRSSPQEDFDIEELEVNGNQIDSSNSEEQVGEDEIL